jgi:hypothetical protein
VKPRFCKKDEVEEPPECPANEYLKEGVCTDCPENTQSLPGRLVMCMLHCSIAAGHQS